MQLDLLRGCSRGRSLVPGFGVVVIVAVPAEVNPSACCSQVSEWLFCLKTTFFPSLPSLSSSASSLSRYPDFFLQKGRARKEAGSKFIGVRSSESVSRIIRYPSPYLLTYSHTQADISSRGRRRGVPAAAASVADMQETGKHRPKGKIIIIVFWLLRLRLLLLFLVVVPLTSDIREHKLISISLLQWDWRKDRKDKETNCRSSWK